MRGVIDIIEGGPNFDRLYHKLKILLLLLPRKRNLFQLYGMKIEKMLSFSVLLKICGFNTHSRDLQVCKALWKKL